MKILITGNKGFIGGHAVRVFREAGHDVWTYEWEEQTLPRVDGLDWVLHFGAISSTTERDVDRVMRQNYEFSVWLYEECRKHDVDLQWSSSASVYGNGTEFKESSPVDPRSPYSWSKYLFERYTEKNPTHRICQGFRYFNVHGEGHNDGESHKLGQSSPHHQFSLQAAAQGVIRVFEGSENMRRDFVPVRRVVEVHKMFIDGQIDESGIWNIGTGKATSFMDVAKKYANQYGAIIQEIAMPENLKSSYQYYTCADLTKLQITLASNKFS